MGNAKDIVLKPISASDANALVKRAHYSGKVVNNSQLHIGVFYNGKLEGAMQFGPSLDKRKIQGPVTGTQWHEFVELNRMAFSDALPRNSESRALGVAMKLLKKYAPQVKWVISFADATQCGDGTIYRASGFVLTGIKKNDQIWQAPTGARESRTSLTDGRSKGQQREAVRLSRVTETKANNILGTGAASMQSFKEAGFTPMPGYQLRYIYFIDPACRQRLTVPKLPYTEIDRLGAGMYRGVKRASEVNGVTADDQSEKGGSSPTQTLTHTGQQPVLLEA
jgi:hypothetical protein